MTSTPTTRASLLLRLRDAQNHQAWVEFVALYEPVAYRRRHIERLFRAGRRAAERVYRQSGQQSHIDNLQASQVIKRRPEALPRGHYGT
jgi:hypothetical protein